MTGNLDTDTRGARDGQLFLEVADKGSDRQSGRNTSSQFAELRLPTAREGRIASQFHKACCKALDVAGLNDNAGVVPRYDVGRTS